MGKDVWQREILCGERDGRDARVEQRRLLGRRWHTRLLPLGQARSAAPKGRRGTHYSLLLPLALLVFPSQLAIDRFNYLKLFTRHIVV
jgi:hypothetical protein